MQKVLRVGCEEDIKGHYHGETSEDILHERRDLDRFFKVAHRHGVDRQTRLRELS